ncbi:MAG: sulfotransferase family protein [Acidobacteria bacterium]|nr:sulfotransferase family protein [Acidobacteriota bacterium]
MNESCGGIFDSPVADGCTRPMPQTIKRTVCILGMHRSGTSCVTGTLEENGVYLGAVARNSPFNLRGNRENPRIMALHNDLLAANGGSWDCPPPEVVWSAVHKQTREEIIREYDHVDCWGFKDPRTLLTLDGWLEALPELSMIGIFRHPIASAKSLQARSGMELEKGIDLWTYYNARMLSYRNRHHFPILSFDLEEAVFREKLAQALKQLNLLRPNPGLEFFDPALRHQVADEPALPLPSKARELLDTLNAAAL